jgi:hypothetical protein
VSRPRACSGRCNGSQGRDAEDWSFESRLRHEVLAPDGREPSYPAAQAGAAGYLAHDAHCLGLEVKDVPQWATSTLLGDFALDAGWRQVGHRVTTVRWERGNMVLIVDE